MRRATFLGTAFALAALHAGSAHAGLWRVRDASGREVVTNVQPSKGARALRGGTLSIASAPGSRPPVLERAVRAERVPERKRGPYVEHVAEAAARHMLSPRLIEAVISVESDFNPQAVSRSGAQGLMQLMPDTAREMNVADPFDPAQNIHGGAGYLRRMLDTFGQDLTLALAAYNAGPSAVQAAGGVPLYSETVDYVRKVKERLGTSVLTNVKGGLVSERGSDGRVRVTNTDARRARVRLTRDGRGTPLITNR